MEKKIPNKIIFEGWGWNKDTFRQTKNTFATRLSLKQFLGDEVKEEGTWSMRKCMAKMVSTKQNDKYRS